MSQIFFGLTLGLTIMTIDRDVSHVVEKMSKLNLKQNRKQYFKTYQKAWATCVHCGSKVKKYKVERHMRAQKCVRVRLAKIKI